MSINFHNLMISENLNELKVVELSELMEDRLFFMVLNNLDNSPKYPTVREWKTSLNGSSVFYLNVNNILRYSSYTYDFGPLNLAMIFRYVDIVREKFREFTPENFLIMDCYVQDYLPVLSSVNSDNNKLDDPYTYSMYGKVVHCVHMNKQEERSNAALLICAYLIIEENWTAYEAYTELSHHFKLQYLPFRDSTGLTEPKCFISVSDCVNALFKAKCFGFYNPTDFNIEEYEKLMTIQHGNINWIVPATMLAFPSPKTVDVSNKKARYEKSPVRYYQYFQDNDVKHIIRLNNKMLYDANRTFVEVANIQHTDLFFTDGTPPSDTILDNFLRISEQFLDEDNDECVGAIAVHCKAGLGRTGTLIAAYIIKHWSFKATEAIAWVRMCRPGSVNAIQHLWLLCKEPELNAFGMHWREKKNIIGKYRRFKYGIYSQGQLTSNARAYEYVDGLPRYLFNYAQHTLSLPDGEIVYCTQSELFDIIKSL